MRSKASNRERGAFRIRTATGSLCLLDLPDQSLTCFVDAVEPAQVYLGMSYQRRDGQSLSVQQVLRLEGGLPAMFLLPVHTDDPNIPTLRTTSRVVAITPIV
jgi:hypothetical protein